MSLVLITSCLGEKSTAKTEDSKVEKEVATEPNTINTIAIEDIKNKLCNDFPKALVLGYNSDASHIEIEPVDNGSGGILHCDVKLFYGKKDYEYWKGQVSAVINQMNDPFWQYNPDRNSALYHEVDGFGDKAVYIANAHTLQILKDGVLYFITPPNRGRRTNSGKETKAIALEIAKHYGL